jgi:putative tricarboxylic transport membrane protein
MKNRDLVSSIFWVAFGGLFVVESLRLGQMKDGVPGPGFLSLLAGIALILLSLSVLISALFPKEKAVSSSISPDPGSLKRLLFALVAMFAYGLVMNILGYLLTTFIFMLFMSRLIEPKGWRTALIMALVTSVLTYIIFVVLMEVQLPRGLLKL